MRTGVYWRGWAWAGTLRNSSFCRTTELLLTNLKTKKRSSQESRQFEGNGPQRERENLRNVLRYSYESAAAFTMLECALYTVVQQFCDELRGLRGCVCRLSGRGLVMYTGGVAYAHRGGRYGIAYDLLLCSLILTVLATYSHLSVPVFGRTDVVDTSSRQWCDLSMCIQPTCDCDAMRVTLACMCACSVICAGQLHCLSSACSPEACPSSAVQDSLCVAGQFCAMNRRVQWQRQQ